MIQLGPNEFYMLLFGWVLAIVFGFLMVYMFLKTPARIFLQAAVGKKNIAIVRDRAGMADFMVGKISDPGSMDVKGLGPITIEENSHVLERKSKVVMYDVFAEIGVSIPQEYAPIIQELRDAGIRIRNFKDYHRMLRIKSDKDFAYDVYKKLKQKKKSDKVLNEYKDMVKTIRKMDNVKIMPYKTYKMYDLASMFPFNISPVYIDAKIQSAVNKLVRKIRMNQQMIFYAGFFVVCAAIAGVIIFKMMNNPDPTVIIETLDAGVKVANVSKGVIAL